MVKKSINHWNSNHWTIKYINCSSTTAFSDHRLFISSCFILTEMRDWVFCLSPSHTGGKKLLTFPKKSRGTTHSLCSTTCSVLYAHWARQQFHVSTAVLLKEEWVFIKLVECFFYSNYSSFSHEVWGLISLRLPVSDVTFNGIIHFTVLLHHIPWCYISILNTKNHTDV